MPTFSGIEQSAKGYVLFRMVDLLNHPSGPISLKQNDKFIKLGTIVKDVYIVGLRYSGHYPDQAGPTLVKAFYADATAAGFDIKVG